MLFILYHMSLKFVTYHVKNSSPLLCTIIIIIIIIVNDLMLYLNTIHTHLYNVNLIPMPACLLVTICITCYNILVRS